MSKAQKLKEEELYNLERKKSLNQPEQIKKYKEEHSKLKREKVKSEKDLKKLNKTNLKEIKIRIYLLFFSWCLYRHLH
jgi:hypothetical protein